MPGRLSNPNANSKTCAICQSANRYEIEQLILSVSPSNPALTLDAIADAYDVSPQDLRVHALMHTPLALNLSEESEASLVENFKSKAGVTSPQDAEEADVASHQPTPGDASALHNHGRLADKLNLREGDMLLASANEMLTTLHCIGRKLHSFAADTGDNADARLVNFCTNSMVNLYTGTASELRKTIEEISQLNTAINGSEGGAAAGLKALAEAIRGSSGNDSAD